MTLTKNDFGVGLGKFLVLFVLCCNAPSAGGVKMIRWFIPAEENLRIFGKLSFILFKAG